MKAYVDFESVNYINVHFTSEQCYENMSRFFTKKEEDNSLRNNKRFRHTTWKGVTKFYNTETGKIYTGLLDQVLDYLKTHEYDIEYSECMKSYMNMISSDEHIDISPYQDKLKLYDYQEDTVRLCLRDRRKTVLSPTASGKTLMIWNIISYLIDQGLKILIVTPLPTQMFKDFISYGGNEELYHKIPNEIKETDKPVTISTRNSMLVLIKNKRYDYFKDFDCVIVDEAHQAIKTSTKIVKACVSSVYRFGLSGTYFKEKPDMMTINGLYGPLYTSITTRELIDRGFIPDINILIVIFKYLEEDRKFINRSDYHSEMEFIEGHIHRNNTVINIALSRPGNTLLLFKKHNHGELLHRLSLERKKEDKQVFYLTGNNKDSDREEVKKILEENDNCLVIASKIFDTGVSIKNLQNLINSSPVKSFTPVAQSIGRTLRNLVGKDEVNVYDIFDDMSIKKTKKGKKLLNPYINYAYKHGIERSKLYEMEQFDCEVISKDLTQTYLEGVE